MRYKMLSGLSAILSLTACGPNSTETGIRTIHDYCLLAFPITFSTSKDTAETVTQVTKHDVIYERTCPTNEPPQPANPDR